MNTQLINALSNISGAANILTQDANSAEMRPFLSDCRNQYHGQAQALIKPGSSQEIAEIVKCCIQHKTPIVPQGGNTSLCGAATPDQYGKAIIVSLARLNRVIQVDQLNNTIVAQAGCILADLQNAAAEKERLFPLSLASEGSCQLGGNLSTNAGGIQVLRYGNIRDLVLGLEVILPNGTIWNGLRTLRKDNTGYDLKHLFIGAEGTLGIVSTAALRLFPKIQCRETLWIAVQSPTAAVQCLQAMLQTFDAGLSAFELVSDVALQLVLKHTPGAKDPFQGLKQNRAPWYVLCEVSKSMPDPALLQQLADFVENQIHTGIVCDAILAQSGMQRTQLWQLRENISEAQRIEGKSIKHDIAVPVSCIPEFITKADQTLRKTFDSVRIVCFGHVGDGNLHYNISSADPAQNTKLLAQQATVNDIVYEIVNNLDGSISAEHGLGQLKRETIRNYKSPVEMSLMQQIKQVIDPSGLMNPGKVI